MNPITIPQAVSVIQEVFREQFLNDSLVVTEKTSPETIEEWDSIAQVGLLTGIEAKVNVQFTAEEMSEIASVSDILRVLVSKGAVS